MSKKAESPLKDKPLRLAGQSLQEELDRVFDDELMEYAFMPIFLLGMLIYESIGWYLELPRQPLFLLILFICLLAYCGFKFWRKLEKIRNLKLGRDGERAVGQFLELFREDGARVFHDLVGDGFNIDHVLISRKGVFVIETKTYRKSGSEKIYFDGKAIKKGGVDLGDKLLIQARAEASWTKKILAESTGKTPSVSPAIVFPGWFVESSVGARSSDVAVINPRQLRGYLSTLPNILSKEDIMLMSYHLSRHIRMTE